MPKLSLAEPALIQAVNFVPPFAEPPRTRCQPHQPQSRHPPLPQCCLITYPLPLSHLR